MSSITYRDRRGQLQTYFDETAADAWKKLTSDAPVSRIRATVRAGRDAMRDTLLSWLPADLSGRRLLDAGCGTGTLAIEAAKRGADVVAIDLSPTLIDHARAAQAEMLGRGSIEFISGDMLSPKLGQFDHIVAMDSLIHYEPDDVIDALDRLTSRCNDSMVFTFAPRTVPLAVMHAVGRLFPRSDRAPMIVPISHGEMQRRLALQFGAGKAKRDHRITSGFYMSHAQEIRM